MTNKIIHVGFPKTGTTSLQQGYFSKHPKFMYIGQTAMPANLKRLVELDMLTKSELDYDKEKVKKAFEKEVNQAYGKTFLFSHEAFTYCSEDLIVDKAVIARRLHDIFGEAKIIITIRRQDDMWRSLYQQAVLGGLCVKFFMFLQYYFENYYTSFFPLLKYIPIVKHYEQLFGQGNVLILCFEEMKENPEVFFSTLANFCNVSNLKINLPHENKGIGASGIFLKRIINRIVPYDLGRPQVHPPIGRLGEEQKLSFRLLYKTYTNMFFQRYGCYLPFNHKIKLPREWSQKIAEIYSDSNKQLCLEYGLPLREYGYPGLG